MATYVLIHGAFLGGWCWDRVEALLRLNGHRTIAPSLSVPGTDGCAAGSHIGLEDHIEEVCAAVRSAEAPDIVLVGHSYGGMPITGAADRCAQLIRNLVYIDAFVPANGDTMLDLRNRSGDRAKPDARAFSIPEAVDGLIPAVPPGVFGLSGDLADMVAPRMRPHPLATITDTIHLSGAWASIPKKTYVRTALFRAPHFDHAAEVLEASSDWNVRTLPLDHCAMITDAAATTEILAH